MLAYGQASLAVTEPPAGEAVLNFVGADIESVIKAVGHYTNMTFIIDPRVKGTINLISERPVTKAQAFGLLSSALRLQGYSIVVGDGYAKVVPEADAKLQAGPIHVPGGKVRTGDQVATQIFHLNYESAPNLVTILRPLISPNNTINADPGTNSLIITDYADNLKRLGKIIAALDGPAGSELDVVPLRHAIASDIATMINRLMEPLPGTGVNERVTVMADTRTNSLLIRAPSVARANLAKSLIAKLDTETDNPGNVHVVYLRNAEAVKLAQTLRAVIASDASASSGGSAPSAPAPAAQPGGQPPGGAGAGGLQSAAPLNAAPSQTNLPTGGPAGFIQADASTNTLIITANEAVYRNLRAVIDKLDTRRAQVYVESLIVEVNADQAGDFGIQWLGLSGDSTSKYRAGGISSLSSGFGASNASNNIVNLATSLSSAGQVANGAVSTPQIGPGMSLGIFKQTNGQLGLGAVLHVLENNANTNILSTPNLLTLDNEEARIIVGQNVPFITGQYTTAASAGAAGVNPFQTVERKDVGISLRVKPQVSEGGTIKLSIYQESSDVVPSSANNASGIITTKRSIETNVLVDDGQIIVLGGLISDTVNDSNEKVPGLGDIPLFGNLFKYQSRTRSKKNLMVFLRPVVIRNTEQSASVVADRYDYIRNAELNAQPADTPVMPTMPAPVLPPLKDGRPVGGLMLQASPPMNNNPQPGQQAPAQAIPSQQGTSK
jgi:general secretion pathway protein D